MAEDIRVVRNRNFRQHMTLEMNCLDRKGYY